MFNGLSQLAALYSKAKKILDVSDVHQNVFMDKLSELLTMLITLDGIVFNQSSLKDHWSSYKRIINLAEMDPTKYKTSKKRLAILKNLLESTDNMVLTGSMFRSCVSHCFDRSGVKIADNSSLGDEFSHYIRSTLSDMEGLVSRGDTNPSEMLKFVGLCGIFVFHNNFHFNTDKKLVSRIMEVCKKLPSIGLYSNLMWFPDQFLLEHLPALTQLTDKKIWSSFSPNRQNYLQLKSSSAAQDIKQFHLQLNGWIMQMEEALTRRVNNLTLDHLQRVASLLLQGLDIANTIRSTVSTILNLHGKLSKVNQQFNGI